MEYGLWRGMAPEGVLESKVLILVLMEYGLWQTYGFLSRWCYIVLILVLMEYGLWQTLRKAYPGIVKS